MRRQGAVPGVLALTYGELGTLGFLWRSFAVLLVDLSPAPPARVRWPWHDGAFGLCPSFFRYSQPLCLLLDTF